MGATSWWRLSPSGVRPLSGSSPELWPEPGAACPGTKTPPNPYLSEMIEALYCPCPYPAHTHTHLLCLPSALHSARGPHAWPAGLLL